MQSQTKKEAEIAAKALEEKKAADAKHRELADTVRRSIAEWAKFDLGPLGKKTCEDLTFMKDGDLRITDKITGRQWTMGLPHPSFFYFPATYGPTTMQSPVVVIPRRSALREMFDCADKAGLFEDTADGTAGTVVVEFKEEVEKDGNDDDDEVPIEISKFVSDEKRKEMEPETEFVVVLPKEDDASPKQVKTSSAAE